MLVVQSSEDSVVFVCNVLLRSRSLLSAPRNLNPLALAPVPADASKHLVRIFTIRVFIRHPGSSLHHVLKPSLTHQTEAFASCAYFSVKEMETVLYITLIRSRFFLPVPLIDSVVCG